MDALVERCAGLDVHQASVVCCILIGVPGRKPQKLLRRFGTTTRELEALRAWLAEHGVTHVGMESTGVYWKPVYAVLEGHVDLIVGNAQSGAQAAGGGEYQVLSGLAPAPLANEGWPGYEAPLTGSVRAHASASG